MSSLRRNIRGSLFTHAREQDFIFRIRIAGETADGARPPFWFPRRLVHKRVGDTALPKNAHLDSNQEATTASLQLIDGIHPRKPKQPAARKLAPNMTGCPQWSPTQKAGTMLCLLSRRKPKPSVSMKSDLEGRNNDRRDPRTGRHAERLNEVRPRRPEQSGTDGVHEWPITDTVSMKSGLEGRNNRPSLRRRDPRPAGLNEVRPGRPEQSGAAVQADRAGRGVSMKSGLEDRNNPKRSGHWLTANLCLNEVRPGRPEQYVQLRDRRPRHRQSQ